MSHGQSYIPRRARIRRSSTLCGLMASGRLFARHHKTNIDESGNPRLSDNERLALATSSPRVHITGKKHPAAHIQKDKSTLIAVIPQGT
ncbi:MAG TPA: hypothetical protein VKG25_12960 [Bryobacteraceae bacterium]|nr:hypothetical protein [Bryobacteraceae bacterium]